MTSKNSLFKTILASCVILIIIGYQYSKQKHLNDISKDTTLTTEGKRLNVETSNFSRGKEAYENNSYQRAIEYLSLVSKTDTNYALSQDILYASKEKIKDIEKRIGKAGQIRKKYEKMFKGHYQFEIVERLSDSRFMQKKTGIEKAPDGSTQVKSYYEKNEDGFLVEVSLQSSYSLSSYYLDIDVTDLIK